MLLASSSAKSHFILSTPISGRKTQLSPTRLSRSPSTKTLRHQSTCQAPRTPTHTTTPNHTCESHSPINPLLIKHDPANPPDSVQLQGQNAHETPVPGWPIQPGRQAQQHGMYLLSPTFAFTLPLPTPQNTHSYQAQGEMLFKGGQSSSSNLSSASNTSLEGGDTGTDGDDAE